MSLDVAQLRADTPPCEHVLHLDHAGSSLPPRCVTDAVIAHLEREATVGGYRAASEAAPQLERFYDEAAAATGAAREGIAFFESATRAWQAVVAALRLGPGDRVLLHRTTYASNALAFLQLERRGVVLELVGSTDTGEIDTAQLREALERPAQLVALTHVPTGSGLIQPAAEVGALARAYGVPFLLDACQSLGQVPVDLRAIGADFLTSTGRKYLRGPRGTGLLAMDTRWLDRLEPAMVDLYGATWTGDRAYALRPDARRFEAFERSFAGQIGLGVALGYGNGLGWAALSDRIGFLGEALRARLAGVDRVAVRDDGLRRGGIVTLTVEGADLRALHGRLRARDIHTSVSHASSSLLHHAARGVEATLRASVHALNTEAELDAFVQALDAEIRRA